jgi:hypothetical protein
LRFFRAVVTRTSEIVQGNNISNAIIFEKLSYNRSVGVILYKVLNENLRWAGSVCAAFECSLTIVYQIFLVRFINVRCRIFKSSSKTIY